MAVAPFLDVRGGPEVSAAAPRMAYDKLSPLRVIPDLDDFTLDPTAATLDLIFDIPGEIGPIAVVLTPAELDGDLEGALARQLPPTEHVADALQVIRRCWQELVADLRDSLTSGALEVLGQPDSLFADYRLIPTRLLHRFVEHDFQRGRLRSPDGDRIEGVVVRLASFKWATPAGADDRADAAVVKSLLARVASLRSTAEPLAWLIANYRGEPLPAGDKALRALYDQHAAKIATAGGGSPEPTPERSFRTARQLYAAAVQYKLVEQIAQILGGRFASNATV
ncbi:MAG TPA: hypothetical protein VGO06_08600 [Bosea sp. (in: a-proteobacteria)]|jgi:hypothetical protein|uniref:hypothetical protein n=1 Tax=Bosea sp. (in: a-proteobacteria) TaxID=1871050 RepID=UPI002E1254A2|nr:hypothetical protein [Bosea sp. (in: a-proteobacteria)]